MKRLNKNTGLVIHTTTTGALDSEILDVVNNLRTRCLIHTNRVDHPPGLIDSMVKITTGSCTDENELINMAVANFPKGVKKILIYDNIDNNLDSRETGDPVDFNPADYMKLNPDIVTNGFNTPELALKHWEQYGQYENRRYIDNRWYDISFYMKHYNDVPKNELDAKNHWYVKGRREGRIRIIEEVSDVMRLNQQICKNTSLIYDSAEKLNDLNQNGSDYMTISTLKDVIDKAKKTLNRDILEIQKIYKRYHQNIKQHEPPGKVNIVYTCVTDSYDQIPPPRYVTSGWRYIMFTDQYIEAPTGWEVIYIKNPGNLTPVKFARQVKIEYWKYLPDHDVNIWVDSNIIIRKDLNDLCNLVMNDKHLIYTVKHPKRKCVYEEAKEVIVSHKDKPSIVNKQTHYYQSHNFPKNFGDFYETNCIIRKNTQQVKDAMSLWFQQILTWSHRDQLSLPYIIWKNNLSIFFDTFDTVVRDNYTFWRGQHSNVSKREHQITDII